MPLYYNNILCVSSTEMTAGILTYSNLNKLITRGRVDVVKRGGGEDNPSLIRYDNLPVRLKSAVIEKYGDPKERGRYASFTDLIEPDADAERFFAEYVFEDGTHLSQEAQDRYNANVRVLNAAVKCQNWKRPFIRALGGTHGVNGYVSEAANAIRGDVRYAHTLPENARRLAAKVAEYRKSGYACLVSGYHGNRNAGKVNDSEQESTLRMLLGNSRNIDNEQVRRLYNTMADRLGWKRISVSTVAKYREKWDLYTYGMNRGETAFGNSRQMLVKREAPEHAMTYWTADGWDVELLYQKTVTDGQGRQVTTYHNRLTVVVVLDACGRFPIGYAVGDHENVALIREAFRDAVRYTAQLFGKMYRPAQVQTDHYGRGALKSFYEAVSAKAYTPARVKNAKSKVVESYFRQLNHDYCQLEMANWSGYGVKSRTQPNPDLLEKNKKNFPDEAGCRRQIAEIMERERGSKKAAYVASFNALPEGQRYELGESDYLFYLGERTQRTIRMQPMGVCPVIGGVQYYYDSFDVRFREHNREEWTLRYDPRDMERVMVSGDGDRLRFVLERKHVQPMAFADRKAGDSDALVRVRDFNSGLRERVIGRNEADYRCVSALMEEVGKDEELLSKVLITDSDGRHKDRRNQARLTGSARKALEAVCEAEAVTADAEGRREADSYLESRVNFSEFID